MLPALAPTLVIAATAVIQSMFGVGVLLLGTPWLLLLGMEFSEVLWTVLPVSMAISALQSWVGWRHVDWDTVKGLALWTVPPVAVALWVTTFFRAPVEPLVAAIVLGVAVMDRVPRVQRLVHRFVERRRTYHVIMGLVHGTSNLGGSLLAALVYARFPDMKKARATIAAGYLMFAAIQLAVLATAASGGSGGWRPGQVLLAVGVFALVEQGTRARLNTSRYRVGLSALLACTGILLTARIFLP